MSGRRHGFVIKVDHCFNHTVDMMPNGTRRKPAFLTDSFLRNNRDGKFPYEDECHYLGLRKQDKEDKDRNLPRLACKKHRYAIFRGLSLIDTHSAMQAQTKGYILHNTNV